MFLSLEGAWEAVATRYRITSFSPLFAAFRRVWGPTAQDSLLQLPCQNLEDQHQTVDDS